MAFESPGFSWSFPAGADLSAKQFYFVELATDGTVTACDATTDNPIGILQNAPASGGMAEVMISGISKVNSDAALTVGLFVGPAADGQAASYVHGTDTTKYICGRVIGASGAAGGYATVLFSCMNNGRAA